MTSIEILTQLIAQKTFVSGIQTERDGMLLLSQLCEKLFPNLPQELQDIGNNRYNLYIGSTDPELLVIGHVDTVLPSDGWNTDPFILTERENRLYGLGTADMKGSIAAFLAALATTYSAIDVSQLGILFYADEEYDFRGMKSFVQQAKQVQPALVLSLDGSLEMASGCRGCIELTVSIETETGHSRLAIFGNNAIKKTLQICELVEQKLITERDSFLGPTTCNIAAIQGGVLRTVENQTYWQKEGNIIPKNAEFVFEVRPAVSTVSAKAVSTLIYEYAAAVGATVTDIRVRHDLTPLPVAYEPSTLETMQGCYRAAGVPFSIKDQTFSGYIDMAMLTAIINTPMVIIGTGGVGHIPNESISMQDLSSAEAIYGEILKKYLASEPKK